MKGSNFMPNPSAKHSGFFALRTPILPFDALMAWGEGARSPTATNADLDDAVRVDREIFEARLRAWVLDPIVREALFLASPSLDAAIEAWLDDPANPRAHGVTAIVARYFARMTARATPFGLFAGCALGRIGGKDTALTVTPRASCRRYTRLDMHYLCALVAALNDDPLLQQTLRYRPSSGLHDSGADIRHAETRIDPVTRTRTHHLVSIEATTYLRVVLERAQGGARVGEIGAALIAADPSVAEDIDAFVKEVIDHQILVSELEPTVTGPAPIQAVIEALQKQPAGARVAERLALVNAALDRLDRDGVGLPPTRYQAITAELHHLPAEPDPARLFHVDLSRDGADVVIGGEVLREIERGLATLTQLAVPAPHEGLRRFREAFVAHYDEQEVPLLEALDEERGLGFDRAGREPSPLLDGLVFDTDALPAEVPFGTREQWMMRRAIETIASGKQEWRLDERDIAALTPDEPASLPDSFAIMMTLAAKSPEALRTGDVRILVRSLAGPPGAALLGRFCLVDEAFRHAVEAHLRAEEALAPHAIVAEIVHLPQGRLGNVLCRPVLRSHEIVYLGASGAPQAQQIPASDLRVSVRQGRIVLRSASLNREVIPRLTSAHNHAAADLGVYRFLCALQFQSSARFGWSWGPIAKASPFLPRVTLGKLVLNVARYFLDEETIHSLCAGSLSARFAKVRALRIERHLPRWVAVADHDTLLPIDFDNVLSVEAFLDLIKRQTRVALEELYPAPDALCAIGTEGRFMHELVIPFVRTEPRATVPPDRVVRSVPPTVERSFPPGSSWLYAKIYAGTSIIDRVLCQAIAPLVRAPDRHFGTWFFLRYADPDPHLRVRFEGDPRALMAELLPALREQLAPFIANRRVRRFELATYEREVERYGGEQGIVLSESAFHADSEAVLSILEQALGDNGNEARWRLALVGMHRLMVALGLDLDARTRLVRRARNGFAREFRANVALTRQLGMKFRHERLALDALLKVAPTGEHPLSYGLQALAKRDVLLARKAAELRASDARGELSRPLEEISALMVHTHINRIVRADQRRQELVLHDLLLRLYESEAARAVR